MAPLTSWPTDVPLGNLFRDDELAIRLFSGACGLVRRLIHSGLFLADFIHFFFHLVRQLLVHRQRRRQGALRGNPTVRAQRHHEVRNGTRDVNVVCLRWISEVLR